MSTLSQRRLPSMATCMAVIALSGCAHLTPGGAAADAIAAAQRDTAAYTAAEISLGAPTDPGQLPSPLSQSDAVDLMLKNSPAVQELIALTVAGQTEADASALPFSLGAGLERGSGEDGIAYSRSLSLNLIELITWPARRELADEQIRLRQLELARDIGATVTEVRLGWVEAVAAAQRRDWAEQARESAWAGAELANRLQKAGNISEAARLARQTALHEADSRLDEARNGERDTRYRLALLTGLAPSQADALQLTSRFPTLPRKPPTTDALARSTHDARLDVRVARQHVRVAAASAGLTELVSLGDAELGLTRESGGGRSTALDITFPLFDAGILQRAAEDQRTLAAVHSLQKTLAHSALQSDHAWATWKQRYDTATRYRDRILPERLALSQETLKRYNAMLIDVFELLDDAQGQIDTLEASIEAEAAFWRADVQLQAALFGLGMADTSDSTSASGE